MNTQTAALGESLRRARGERSLQEVSGQARISTAYLHKLEGGRVGNPSPRVLERVAGVLGVPYWTLMDLAGYVPATEAGPPRPRRRQKESPVNEPDQKDTPTNARMVELLAEIAGRLQRLEEKQEELARVLENAKPAAS